MPTPPTAPRRALIVIDVQNEYLDGGLPIEYPDPQQALANIGGAMDAAHAAQIPTVLVQQMAPADSPLFAEGSQGWQLHTEVARRPHALLLQKSLPSAFAGTGLAAWLQQQRIDTLSVAGFMTHNCDASTVFDALHAGLAVEFLHDAAGALGYRNQAGAAQAEEIHRVFCVVLQSRFAAVLATKDWIAGLRSGAPPVRDNIYASNRRARGLL
ncbi:MAG TPA: cysteine hydrolase family protein [Pseudorhodoferax sp.]|nr:cysteine hydrolase family protein [Pseudorhodoferax sp.]